MAHTPLKISGDQAQEEVREAWTTAYSPAKTRQAIDSIRSAPMPYRICLLVARIFFRGIYFPQTTAWSWLKVIAQNRGSILHLIRESFTNWNGTPQETQPEPRPIVRVLEQSKQSNGSQNGDPRHRLPGCRRQEQRPGC